MGSLWQDMRYGIRTLAKNRSFTVIAILTLALGIGANTAIFSMVDTFLLRPLPVKDAARIVVLASQQKGGPLLNQFSMADYRDIKSQTNYTFSDVVGYQIGMDGLSVNGRPDRIMTNYVSGNFFSALQVNPAYGRLFLPSEGETLGADPVMVLGYDYWMSHFSGDPGIVGQKVTVDGKPITIIGIAPKGFYGTYSLLDTQAYLPIGMASLENVPDGFFVSRKVRNFTVLAMLRDGVSLSQTQATLSVVSQRLAQQAPDADKDITVSAYPERLARPQPIPNNPMVVISGLFMALAALVLVLACVNVANILLVRSKAREREMAIRAALGAARSRLVRQLLTESILLALGGGIAGILLGLWGSRFIASIRLQTDLPVLLDFRFDWRVFTFAFAAALFTGIIVGLVPAIRASRGNLNAILHEGGRGTVGGHQRMRSTLVVAQVAGSLMLLIIAGLFVRSLQKAQKISLGFDPSHVLNLSMDPNEIGYNESQGLKFSKELLARIRALPGVGSASLASMVPMGYYNNFDSLQIAGYQPPPGQPAPLASFNLITPGYFETLKIPVMQGRAFTDADDAKTQHVAIINEAMAKRFWSNQDPIGREFQMATDPKHTIQVVGIAKDSRYHGMSGPFDAFFYIPLAQNFQMGSLFTLQIRTMEAPQSLALPAEKVIQSLAPDLPVFDVKTMTEALDTLNGMLIFQFGAGLAAALGILGLSLAIVGVYGVISYTAAQRTHEIGVRLALGAQRSDILKMILRQGLIIVGIGVAIGLAGAAAAGRVAGNFLPGVSPTDPLTYASVTLMLCAVAIAACYIPARRAMGVDPMVALRYE
ncbi:MAG TPA: ABC transporter permease [Candidatus Acidoferrales bacterium]|nr:ABC transporter permease [Candidatus Acidoferrales bacterium]